MTEDFDPKVLGGSVKRRIVNPDLLEERQKCNFDKEELKEFIYEQESIKHVEKLWRFLKQYPELNSSVEFYEMSRAD